MPHDIAMIDGKPAMMFVGQVPWHGLGREFDAPPKDARAVIKAAGLDWQVVKKPVYAFDGGHYCRVPGYMATVREDMWGCEECEPFGLVGEEYCVLQNAEAFQFFDPIVGTGKISYETAGALGHGERVWVLARVKEPVQVKSDLMERFLLLSNGHDGRTALRVRFTPIRVVCQNTLSWALRRGQDLMKSHHGAGMERRLEDAQAQVQQILGLYESLAGHWRRFAARDLTGEKLTNYITAVFPTPNRKARQTERSYQATLAHNGRLRDTSARLFEAGQGNQGPGVKGTLWAAYNGVTELVDHHMDYKNRWERLRSIWFGEGERIKQRAFEVAVDFTKN